MEYADSHTVIKRSRTEVQESLDQVLLEKNQLAIRLQELEEQNAAVAPQSAGSDPPSKPPTRTCCVCFDEDIPGNVGISCQSPPDVVQGEDGENVAATECHFICLE